MARPKTILGGRPAVVFPRAKVWLRAYLSRGPRSASEIKAAGRAQGFGWATLRRVKDDLGAKSIWRDLEWHWNDPQVVIETTQPTLQDIAKKLDDIRQAPAKYAPPLSPQQDVTQPIQNERSYNPNDPKNIARAAELNRLEQMQNVIQAADPFSVLNLAKDDDEIAQMLTTVRNHHAQLGEQSPIWGPEEEIEVEVSKTEHKVRQIPKINKKGKPVMRAELVRDRYGNPVLDANNNPSVKRVPETVDEAYEETVMVTEKRKSQKIIGHEPLPDSTVVEIKKWEDWIDRARDRKKQLRTKANAEGTF